VKQGKIQMKPLETEILYVARFIDVNIFKTLQSRGRSVTKQALPLVHQF
jgi:hypothetical protein